MSISLQHRIIVWNS